MNKQELDVLLELSNETYTKQRDLAEKIGYSLGTINQSLKVLIEEEYLDENNKITNKAKKLLEGCKPKNAIILAAGFGMRMVPINTEVPKAFLEVDGEPLIERIIKQLHEVGITEIYVVVGFLKDQFEYLIDEYDVELVYNKNYSTTNNLHSLNIVSDKISNTYIIPCDIWCKNNPFKTRELYSWYMVSDLIDDGSDVRVNRKMELVGTGKESGGNAMLGISYLTEDKAQIVRQKLKLMSEISRYDGSFWEETLFEKDRMIVYANLVHFNDAFEINTYEQLRELDADSNTLKTDAIEIIEEVFGVDSNEIVNIEVVKKGMTNRSFLFECNGVKYIMRIPGEGTDMLINRKEEAQVYHAIDGYKICDDIEYINPDNGYKITRFLENARNCDAENDKDLDKCMKKLRDFHDLKLKVDHRFDIFGQIEFYESLWDGRKSIYKDYQQVKAHVMELQTYIDKYKLEESLTHIDAIPDNFLFITNGDTEEVRLIDWEYAGMQDPHVDVAMFCIYSLYDKEQVDHLIDLYFEKECSKENRIKIYCYIASCGLLWSNWCEYKRNLGIEFGEYSLRQYRYAKEYYKYATELMQ